MKVRPALPLLLLASLDVGCGEPRLVPVAARPAACPTASAISEPFLSPLKLGHYTTADGVVSFVLDRVSDPPRLQFDGERAIYQLTQEELRKTSQGYFGVAYVTPSGKELLRVSKEGVMELKRNGEYVPVVRDADARPLPSPTVTGTPRPQPDPVREYASVLTKRAVVTLHPDVTKQDSLKLDVVERVLAELPSELFVVLEDADVDIEWLASTASLDWGRLAPSVGLGIAWSPSAKGLGKFGVIARASTHPFGVSRFELTRLDGYPPNRQPMGPGVIWSVDERGALYVTVDGGRYLVPLRQYDAARGLRTSLFKAASWDAGAWPARVEHVHVDETGLRERARLGELDEALLGPLDAAQAAWTSCTKSRWATTGGLRQNEDHASFSENEKRRLQEVIWKVRPSIVESCRRHVAAYESSALTALTSLTAKRQAMLDRLRLRRAVVQPRAHDGTPDSGAE